MSTPVSPVGNTVIVSASGSSTFTIPAGMICPAFFVANLNTNTHALISFVTAAATAGEAVNNYPIIPFDEQTYIVDHTRNKVIIQTTTDCAVTLVYHHVL